MFMRNGKTVLNGEEYARIDFVGERVGIDMLQHPALLVNLKETPNTEKLVEFLNGNQKFVKALEELDVATDTSRERWEHDSVSPARELAEYVRLRVKILRTQLENK